MRIIEFLPENKLMNLQIDKEFDRLNNPSSTPPPPVQEPNPPSIKGPKHYILVNGRPWKRGGTLVTFTNRQKAMNSAHAISSRAKGRVRIEIKEV